MIGPSRCGAARVLAAALLAAAPEISLAGPLQAPETAAPPAASFGDRVEVSVVGVEVYVTDREGSPVRGLGAEDFLLFEDGEPVAITNFFAVEGGQEAIGPEAAPAPEGAAEPPAAAPSGRRTSLVVYVDQVNLQPGGRKRALRRLREFLAAKVAPGTPVMVVSYDRSLRVAAAFTAHPSAVAAALDALEEHAPSGVEAQAARRNTLAQIRSLFDAEGCSALDALLSFAASYARPRHHDVEASLAALTRFADSLAGLPGRKVLLHVSDGIPLVAGEEMYELIDELCPTSSPRRNTEATEFRATRALRRLTTHAGADGVTLYTLEASGLQGYTSADPGLAQSTLSARMDFNAVANHQDTLFNMAEETGGRALLNSNRLDRGLDKVAADLANYYSLGFSPRHAGDGREHALAVRVRREGLEVRHRRTYRDKPAAERAEERLLAALVLGQEEYGLGARLEAGGIARGDGAPRQVTVRLRVPFASLALLPGAAGREARLRLALVARDRLGDSSPVRRLEVPIRVPEAEVEAALARDFVYELRLGLAAGGHRLAVGVEDAATGVTSYLGIDLEIPN